MPKTPREIVDAYLSAISKADFEAARRCLADRGFSYLSPLGSFDDADAFIADIARIGLILEGVEYRRNFVDDNEVCSILNFLTRMDRLSSTAVVHWTRIENGRIVRIEAFFDASEYTQLFDTDSEPDRG